LVTFDVAQYQQMIRLGILTEGAPIELLDGMLVLIDRSKAGNDIMAIGDEHCLGVRLLNLLDSRLQAMGCFMQTQLPLRIDPDHEPQPDGLIVTGNPRIAPAKPMPSDVSVIFEVADSSLQHDRTTKQRIYADAGIPMYLITNLIDRCIEAMSDPVVGSGRYATTVRAAGSDPIVLKLRDGQSITIRAEELLP
jgi:hypothetical protein